MGTVEQLLAERGEVYGPPEVNHRRIADLVSTYLEHEITPAQAAMIVLLVKVARLIQTPDHEDSIDDIIGYAECYRACVQETIVDEAFFAEFMTEVGPGGGKHRRV